MFDRIVTFLRNEAVLCIAFICACVSIMLTGDVASIPSYIDWRVIVLLFCLMAAVAGLRESGVMAHIARALVEGERKKWVVCLVLVMLPFFASMLVTNDVSLLTFVPIAVIALDAANWRDSIARVIILQAIAANLGGMVTPVGNPQNLFIFTTYELSVSDFFWTLIPFGLLAFVLLVAACFAFGPIKADVKLNREERTIDTKRLALHACLFALSLLAVLRILSYIYLLPIVVVALLLFDRHIFMQVDYALLATFVCFFVFSGNLSNMPAVQEFLGGVMGSHPMLTSLFASQVISNVPAAVLLAPFTQNWHSLLIGVDLGGLGTPIASLASLIAFKIYMHTNGARASVFMRDFGIANVVMLLCMVALYTVLFV